MYLVYEWLKYGLKNISAEDIFEETCHLFESFIKKIYKVNLILQYWHEMQVIWKMFDVHSNIFNRVNILYNTTQWSQSNYIILTILSSK